MKKHLTVFLVGICGVALAVGLVVLTALVATDSFRYRKTKLVIQTGSANKMFDGEPLTSKTWSIVSGELSKEHTLEVKTTGQQVDVGKSDNFASIRIVDTSGMDVTDQYEIDLRLGTLEVVRRKLTFISDDGRKIYDGQQLVAPNAALASGRLSAGETWEGYGFAEPTEVGRYPNTFQVKITDSEGRETTDNYEIVYEPGELYILYGELILESGTSSKEYDGTPLTDATCSVRYGQVQPGHHIEVESIGTITKVGLCNNVIRVRINDAQGKDVTDFYEIDYRPGILTVTPRQLLIRTLDVKRAYYDAVIRDDWQLISGELVEGDHMEISTTQSYTSDRPGTYDNLVLSYYVWSQYNGDVSSCYQATYQCGKLYLTD